MDKSLIKISNSLPTEYSNVLPIRTEEWRVSMLRSHWHTLLKLNRVSSSTYGEDGLVGICMDAKIENENMSFQILRERVRQQQKEACGEKNAYVFDVDRETVNRLLSFELIKSVLENFGKNLVGDRFQIYNISGMYAETICKEAALVSPEVVDSAAFWHRDATSLCYKLFLCLETSGDGVETQFVVSTGVNQPLTEAWEIKRSQELSSAIDFDQMLTMRMKQKIRSSNIRSGEIMLFNTNAIHRGNYITDALGSRTSIQVSFGPKEILKHYAVNEDLSTISNIPYTSNERYIGAMDIIWKQQRYMLEGR